MARHSSVLSQPLNLVWLVVGIVVAVSVITALLPTMTTSFDQLTTNATQVNNPIVKAVSPAIPFMVGVGILGIILIPVMLILKKVKL